jgi:hypothetical protein
MADLSFMFAWTDEQKEAYEKLKSVVDSQGLSETLRFLQDVCLAKSNEPGKYRLDWETAKHLFNRTEFLPFVDELGL